MNSQIIREPEYEIRVEKDRPIVMKDDIRLYCDVYRPDDKERHPVLVGFSPFGKAAQEAGRRRDPIQLGKFMYEQGIEIGGIDFFASRGYTVVVVNPRGIQNSEGVWTGVLSRQDQIDCCEVIRWAGHYLSDGSVGMIGCGYAGKIQPFVAAMDPPYLKAIMPVDVIDDMYLDCYPGGILSDINYPLCSYIPHTNTISEAEMENSPEDLKEMLAEARRQPEIATNSYYYRGLDSYPPRHYTWNIDVMLHPYSGEWWDRRSFKDRKVTIPSYIVGLYYEYGHTTISAYDIYNKIDDEVPKKLMMIDPASAKTSPYEKPVAEQLRWYDYWLKGIGTGVMDEPPMKLLVRGINKFRYEHEWPLARTQWTKYYLRDGGLLSTEKEKDEHVQLTILNHKSPYEGGSNETYAVPNVVFRTPVLEEDVEVTGPSVMNLMCAIDKTDANFTIMLNDVPPEGEGRPLNLVTGNLRASHRGLEKKELKPWELNNDHTRNVPVVPGEINEYTIEVMNTSNVFRKGHRIEVEVKNYDANPYHWMVQLPNSQDIEYKIFVDSIRDSYINLPIIPYSDEDQWIR